MKTVITGVLMVLVSAVVFGQGDRLSRIGGYTGDTHAEISDDERRALENPVLLHLSEIGEERHKIIFESLQVSLIKLGGTNNVVQWKKPAVTHEGMDYIQDKDFTDNGFLHFDTTVSQSAGEDRYLVDHATKLLVIPGKTELPDGAGIEGFGRKNGIYEFVDTRGAKRRVEKYELLESSPVSLADFLLACKQRQSFKCLLSVEKKCPDCNGTGKIKKGTSSLSIVCRRCRKTPGKVTLNLCHSVIW